MTYNVILQQNETSFSNKTTMIMHDLNQSLLVIQAYITGCAERIKANNINYEQLNTVFLNINKQVELMSYKIQEILQKGSDLTLTT